MKVIHRAASRGRADHGWLHSHHTFSFASYHNPDRMGFGKLRVLNDDVVQPGAGFGTHPHDNMEIVSIPLAGSLRHQDSTGNTHIIRQGEIQIMSAGSGLTHSEHNNSDSEEVNFLQIWVLPKERDIKPRYDQKLLDPKDHHNRFHVVVSSDTADAMVWINQDAWFALGDFSAGSSGHYTLHGEANGVYLFVIDGEITIADEQLKTRDAIGLTDLDSIDVAIHTESKLLVMEVPMH